MAALIDLINFQLQSAQSLSHLLDKEKQAITARISIDIENIAKEKLNVINQLQQTDQRIAAHPHLAELMSTPQFKETVSLITSIIADCQQRNETNGKALLRAQLSFNKLNNMMQQSHGKIGMTYSADGQTHTISTLGTNVQA